MIISIHIPKCGGTSFRSVLEGIYGERLWLNYGIMFSPAQVRTDLIPRDTRCIHGHFLADTFDALAPPPRLVTWLRHPVERVVSNYYHFLRSPDRRDACCRQLLDQGLSLEQFAELDWMRNEATRYMAGKSVEAFAFVGIMERFDESMQVFSSRFGVPVPAESPRANVNPDRSAETYSISVKTYEHILSLNFRDLLAYDLAAGIIDRQVASGSGQLVKWFE
jgi:hypothetical protein